MNEEIKLPEEVNEKIKNKVNESTTDYRIKNLLIKLLNLELEHLDEKPAWYNWKEKYLHLIKSMEKDLS